MATTLRILFHQRKLANSNDLVVVVYVPCWKRYEDSLENCGGAFGSRLVILKAHA